MTISTARTLSPKLSVGGVGSYQPSSEVSFNQEQICLLEAFYPDTKAYNAQAIIRLTGAFDPAVFEAAVNDVISRHESLRTTISLHAKGYLATVHSRFEFEIGYHDLSEIPEVHQEDAFEDLKLDCMRRTFDLETLPLLDIHVVCFGQDVWRLIHVEHHVVHDGWSFGLFWNEVQQAYNAFKAGQPPDLAAPPVQYQQFVAWQRKRIRGDYGQTALTFWRDYLEGTALEISVASGQSTGSSLAGRNFEFSLSSETCNAVKGAARRFNVSEFMVMFSVFSITLSQASGVSDFAIGTAVSARTETEIEPMIGMVVNTTPIRVVVEPDAKLRSVCHYVRTSLFQVLRYQDLPLSSLVRELGIVQKRGRNPIFQHCFSFHDSSVPRIELEGVEGYIEETQNQTAKFDINVVTIPAKAERGTVETRMFWQFSDGLFGHEECCALIEAFLSLLNAINDAE